AVAATTPATLDLTSESTRLERRHGTCRRFFVYNALPSAAGRGEIDGLIGCLPACLHAGSCKLNNSDAHELCIAPWLRPIMDRMRCFRRGIMKLCTKALPHLATYTI